MIPFAEIDHVLIFFSIFLCVSLMIYRTLRAWVALGAFFCACLFILVDGHYWLGAVLLPEGRNPQIATVGLMLATATILTMLAALRRTRSFDRIIVGVASISVLLTSGLFHYVLVQQVLPAWAKDAAWGNSYLLAPASESFEADCAEANLACWNAGHIKSGGLPDAFKQQIEGVYMFYQSNKTDGEVGYGFGVFNDLGQDGVAVILFHMKGEDIRVIADPKTGIRIHSKVRDLFYLLDTTAHVVWIAGALFLIAFHRRRFSRRVSSADRL
ncbi:TPA: hypothetical protein SL557_000376 [Pseudomonas aeruginosa]|nr:hypothetical protein [Pseudomonas aeruginosa]